jgi:diacylglycerol kinase family enzyme
LKAIPVVLNPTARGGRLLRFRPELDATARRLGVELDWWLTEEAGHGEELGRRAVAEGRSVVLAYGGDGTYNEVARGLVGTDTSLAALPGGTSSVLVYELGIPRRPSRALEALIAGVDRPMRVGRSNHGDVVVLMLSAGPDAVIVNDVKRRLKAVGGKAGIGLQAVRELLGSRPLPRLRVRVGERTVEGSWVIAGNSRSYAGPFHATPGADPFAAGFEVVIHRGVGRSAVLGFAAGIPFNRHVKRRDVERFMCHQVVIEAVPTDAELPYQVDGDAVGTLPVELGVADETLLVRVPSP